MNKLNKKILVLQSIFMILVIGLVITYFQNKINNQQGKYISEINDLKTSYEFKLKINNTYKDLYTNNEKELLKTQRDYSGLKTEYDNYKNSIAIAKQTALSINRGGNQDLREFSPINKDELNQWISKVVPNDSPFRGRADVFIKASQESGIDPKVILSIASLESGYGRSQIAREKNNYFGIAAYNASPYSSSYNFGDGLENGIVQGAIWIANNYTNKGQPSLNSMLEGKIYCQSDSGEANWAWRDQILNITNSN